MLIYGGLLTRGKKLCPLFVGVPLEPLLCVQTQTLGQDFSLTLFIFPEMLLIEMENALPSPLKPKVSSFSQTTPHPQ